MMRASNKNSTKNKKMIALLLVSVLFVAFLPGQTTDGTISGTVKDESGAVLPGVTVTSTSKETGSTRTAITDDAGYFRIPQLSVGAYELQAELGGFNAAVVTGLSLYVGQEIVVNPILKVGDLSEKVTVTGEAALVETTSATVAAVVDEKQIRDLPLNGRSFTQLALLQEGVISPVNAARTQIGNEGQKISIGGTRTTQTSFLLDGTEIRNQLNTTPGSVGGVMLGVDTVREFNVVTSVASAEYGRFTGGVVNAVSRSGTNEFHGSLFEFLRNSALDARNFFDRNPRNPTVRSSPPPFKRNQFGFTVGGPIQHDKTFFFGSYEGLRDRLSDTEAGTVPTAAARLGIFPTGGNVTVDPRIRPYLNTMPLPNSTDFGNGTGEYLFNNVRPTDEDYFMAKIDHIFNDANSLYGRYTFDQGDKTRLEGNGLWGLFGRNRSQFFTLEEKMIFSSNLLNTARVSYNRTQNADGHFQAGIAAFNLPDSLKFVPLPERDFGDISIGGLTGWGPSGTNKKDNVLNRFEWADTVVWTRGRHSMKFGASIIRLQFNFTQTARSRGTFAFANLRDFLTAAPQSFDTIFGPYIKSGIRQSIMGFFIQDDFRMTPNLTWNLGLRYEFYTNPTEVAGRLGNLDGPSDKQVRVGNPMLARNPSLKNFAPRVGFAWNLFGNNKTSLRGGSGLFYDLIQPVNYYVWPQFNVPLFPRVTLSPRPSFPDAFTSITDTSKIIPGVWVLFSPEQAYVFQYNLTLQHEVLPQTVISLGYQGSRGMHLNLFRDANTALPQVVDGRLFNPAPPAAGCPADVFNVPGCRRNPYFGQMRAHGFDAMSFYNAFKFSLQRRFANSFQVQSAFTFGRSVDDGSNDNPFDSTGTSPNGVSNSPDDHKWNRGLSSFHVKKVWSLNGMLELPFGPGKRFGSNLTGAMARIAGGWQLSGIATLASGPPVNLLLSFERSRSRAGVDIADRPDLKSGANNNPVLADGRDPNLYYDPNSFAVPELGFFGNLGRGTVIGPGVATLDFSLTKNTAITESTSVQFRAELFNVLNRANFSTPNGTVFTSATAGPSATAGRITTTTTTARQVQFGLKILF